MSMLTLVAPQSLPVATAIAMPGVWEWMVILVIVLVVFGPSKLPQIGEALGKSIKGFKKAVTNQDEIDVTPTAGQISEPNTQVPRSTSTEEQGARKA